MKLSNNRWTIAQKSLKLPLLQKFVRLSLCTYIWKQFWLTSGQKFLKRKNKIYMHIKYICVNVSDNWIYVQNNQHKLLRPLMQFRLRTYFSNDSSFFCDEHNFPLLAYMITLFTFGHFSSHGISAMTSTASAPPTPMQIPPRPPPLGVWLSVPINNTPGKA